MLRKVSRNIFAWVVVLMTILGMTSMNMVTAKAEDENQVSVTFSDVTYDVNSKLYSVSNPTINIPAGKSVTYVTINVANGTFNTSAITGYGTHHYNYGGNQYYAYSDLIILNSSSYTANDMKKLFSSITFTYNASSNSSSADGIAIYATMSTNKVTLPSTNFSFYQIPGTNHYYMYVPGSSSIAWHDAYNQAKGLEFGGLIGYLATISDANENNIMRNINGTTRAWVGGTSIYYLANGDASAAFNTTTWQKINDTVIDTQPATGAYGTPHGEDSNSSNLYKYYYWACGPESGSQVSSSVWAIAHGVSEPNGSDSTNYDNTLKRASNDNIPTEDCALTNWDGGLLNDYADMDKLQGYFVEFTADPNYLNGIDGGNYKNWSLGNANTSFIATMKTATAVKTINSVSFNKYLIMPSDAVTPYVGFNFSVTAGSQVTDANGKIIVYAGDAPLKVSGTPTIKTIQNTAYNVLFSIGQETFTEATANGTVNLAAESKKKYAVSTGTVDFSSVTFTEPGVYRYILKETTPNYAYTENDTSTLILDVYVTSNNDNNVLAVTNSVLHTSLDDVVLGTGGELKSATKTDGFVNNYITDNLTVNKTVSGNQSRTDQYFDFNYTISGAVAGTKYTLNYSEAVDLNGNVSTRELVADANGNVTGTVYLKAGTSFTIIGLAKGTKYSVGENTTTLTDTGYTSTLVSEKSTGDMINGLTGSTALAMDATTKLITDNGISADTSLVVNNEKVGIIPTGVIIAVAPYATIALCGFFGLIVFARHKKSKDDEEEDQ
jgi:hypothetical protein